MSYEVRGGSKMTTKLIKTFITSCNNCPKLRWAQDQKSFFWLVCPDLERLMGKEGTAAITIPDDCPLFDVKSEEEQN